MPGSSCTELPALSGRETAVLPHLCVCSRVQGVRGGASFSAWRTALSFWPWPQIAMYESELEQAHGQMLEEMQSLEEDKNRAIEEAFARAQVEMKAVHENLAGEPSSRALACPTPPPFSPSASHPLCLHRCPDQPADAAASAADPDQRLQWAQASGARLPAAAARGPQERQGRGECSPWRGGAGRGLGAPGQTQQPLSAPFPNSDKAPRWQLCVDSSEGAGKVRLFTDPLWGTPT